MADAPIERVRARVLRVEPAQDDASDERVSVEEPLEIRVHAKGEREPTRVAVTMRTPGHEDELAVGFLFTEGLIDGRDDLARPAVRELSIAEGVNNVVTVRLDRAFDPSLLQRNFFATSSCGVCGKASIDQVERAVTPITERWSISRSIVAELPSALRAAQKQFDATGGLHACALFRRDGELELVREDVGRHNAMDKVIGRSVLAGRAPLVESVMMVSGRISFELVQKAAMAGVPLLCAVSAPSSLAIRAAERFGQTLVGFVRDGRCTVYSHASRVT
ncbi:MAG: formate dehydrogenase accessory sulfurtransferase FdhD [Myxococcales bacterium]|nr:formate dehydrogenase accessory sulfurtransferase FdhD [Myxococcales bacterium]